MAKTPRHIIQHEVMDELPKTLTAGYLEDPDYFEWGLKSIQEMYRLSPEQLRGMTVAQYLLERFENDVKQYSPADNQIENSARVIKMISFLRNKSRNDDSNLVDPVIISTIRMMVNLFNLDAWKLMGEGLETRVNRKAGGGTGKRGAPAIIIALAQLLPALRRKTAEFAWSHLEKNFPSGNAMTVTDNNGQEHDIYIDGNSCCQTNPDRSIKKSTFQKYFSKAKKLSITK